MIGTVRPWPDPPVAAASSGRPGPHPFQVGRVGASTAPGRARTGGRHRRPTSRRPGRIWLTLAVAVVTVGAGVVIIDHQARGDSSTAVTGGADEPAAPDLQSPRWWDGSSIQVPSMDSFGLAAAARRPAVVQLAAVQELTSPAAPPASSRPSVTAAVAPTVVQAPSA